jgi:lysozyme
MTIETLASVLIRTFEGLRLSAYQGENKVWTIGYGHTEGVGPGMTVTLDQAEALLAADCIPFADLVRHLGVIAGAAYVDFGFDRGRDALIKVLEGNGNKLEQYIYDRNGVVSPSLVRRRNLETALIRTASLYPLPLDTSTVAY